MELTDDMVAEVAVHAFPHGAWYRLTIEEQDAWKAMLGRIVPVFTNAFYDTVVTDVLSDLGDELVESLLSTAVEGERVTLTEVRRAVDALAVHYR
jgi:hypothetical protein